MPTLGEWLALCKGLADHGEPHTPESLAAYKSQVAAVRQLDEAKRAAPSPQSAFQFIQQGRDNA